MASDEEAVLALRRELMLIEHAALQAKIDRSVNDLFRVETLIPLAIAVFYTWLAKDGGQVYEFHWWILWMPVLLVMIGCLRQEARYHYVNQAEKYLMRIEQAIYGPEGAFSVEGWENNLQVNGSQWNRHLRRIVWAVLLVGTVILAWTGFAPTGA